MSPVADVVLALYVPRERTPHREAMSPGLLDRVASALEKAGARPVLASFEPDTLPDLVRRHAGCAVLNMAYGCRIAAGEVLDQPTVASLVEQAGFATVGSPADVQRLVQDKHACGERLKALGFSVPHCHFTPPPADRGEALFVVKPRFGAAHRDVRLTSASALAASSWPPLSFVVQDYVEPPEFTVAVVGTEAGPVALPALRMESASAAAWVMTSGADWEIVVQQGDPYGVRELAIGIFEALGMRDVARIDMRIRDGIPIVLDVNSLPNLDPERSYLPMAAAAAGWTYDQLIEIICRRARRAATTARGGG